ncbi:MULTISPECIES: hypothetical protein [unclassified Mesorhizobium]|uniref:hypothetical protein n=1 Tax=unclassified Mesorhizobium TaxID=325217 RepID=UPI001FEDD338|nr:MULTISPECIES: hypothetical protein [unclassified Mesorhizobium]
MIIAAAVALFLQHGLSDVFLEVAHFLTDLVRLYALAFGVGDTLVGQFGGDYLGRHRDPRFGLMLIDPFLHEMRRLVHEHVGLRRGFGYGLFQLDIMQEHPRMIFFNANRSQRMQRSVDGERWAGDRLTKRRSEPAQAQPGT